MPAEVAVRKVVVIGLDGLDPRITGSLMDAGELPNLAHLRATGAYTTVRTTCPAQTPVAWSTFATGTNPGGHGIFDFVRRDPDTYLPDLALNRYEHKSTFLPPRVVNLRRGRTIWDALTAADLRSVVLRCPCTYPPDRLKGRMLSGMGVPDLRGGLGTSTFYTTRRAETARESEHVVLLTPEDGGRIRTHLIGPRNPKTATDVLLDLEIERSSRSVTIRSSGRPSVLSVAEGEWSDWVKVKFKVGMLQSVHGMVRFHLARTDPDLELYASPVNFDSETPLFPISAPWDYAGELERAIGTFYTTGMVEDHSGLNNGRFDELAYLDQCESALQEREAMLHYELDRLDAGFLYCLFDTPDRIQHMFWRFREAEHPANGGAPPPPEMQRVIEDHYRACDAIVGRVLTHVDDGTLLIVLSDHGFSGFQRGVHLNTWLYDQGLLRLKNGYEPGEGAADFLRHVDWDGTRAYALGLGSVYLNLRGREAEGIVSREAAGEIGRLIVSNLTGLVDHQRDTVAIRSVATRGELYAGPFADESPDLVVNFAPGYRVSWGTALGEIPNGQFEDNIKRWSGDHIIDPLLVPGVLFVNRPLAARPPHLVDLAPTILQALGVAPDPQMEGESLLA